jgi:hypothetical protein
MLSAGDRTMRLTRDNPLLCIICTQPHLSFLHIHGCFPGHEELILLQQRPYDPVEQVATFSFKCPIKAHFLHLKNKVSEKNVKEEIFKEKNGHFLSRIKARHEFLNCFTPSTSRYIKPYLLQIHTEKP